MGDARPSDVHGGCAVEDVLLRCLAEGYEFLRTPRGLQLLSWASVLTLAALTVHLTRLSSRNLDDRIKQTINKLENFKHKGRKPKLEASKTKRCLALQEMVHAEQKILRESIMQYVIAIWVIPTIALVLVIFWHGLLFGGQAGLAISGKCNCGTDIVDPSALQAFQFLLSETLPSGVAAWIMGALSINPVIIEVKAASGLAIAIWMYKIGIPAATGKYYVDRRELRRALNAAPEELLKLEAELGASCTLADGQSIEPSQRDLALLQNQPGGPNLSVA